MKEKVVSFKTSDEIYNKLKQTGKSFRSILEPLLSQYLQNIHTKGRYTLSIPKYFDYEYKTISDIDKRVDRLLKLKGRL